MGNKNPNFVVIGLALFSMFFGSGNLIYPLMLGRDAGSDFLISSLGFVLSAVLIPCLGVLAITLAHGRYEKIFMALLPKPLAITLIFIILLSFIPFGAGPRCVVLAHSSLKTFIWMPPLWLFSLVFLALAVFFIYDRNHLINNLGKILTPLLLISISVMVISSIIHGEMDPPLKGRQLLFKEALLEGYNTQDLLSSLFFSSSLILLMKAKLSDEKTLIKTMIKGAAVGILLLATLYVFLMAASSLHNDILLDKSGVELVSILANHTLGPYWGLVAGIAVALACFTTAIALVLSFSEFMSEHFFKKQKWQPLALSAISVFITSLLQFEGIMAIVSPMMQIIYPVILLVVVFYLVKIKFKTID